MIKPLLLGLPGLLCSFGVVSGAFLDRHHSAAAQVIRIKEKHASKIIQCRMCHLQFPGQKCSRGRGICVATEEELCATVTILNGDGTPWLTFMGCLKSCANVNHIKWSKYLVNFRCCRGYDRCNEYL